MAGVLIPVTCGVGIACTTQLALTDAHSKLRLVLGGRPAPVTVIFAPTIAAVGDTVIEDEVVAALAGPANSRTHSRAAAVAAREILARPNFPRVRFEERIGAVSFCHLLSCHPILKK